MKEVNGLGLSERKKRILRAVIENYIATAEPVGSKAVAALAGLGTTLESTISSGGRVLNILDEASETGVPEAHPGGVRGRFRGGGGVRLSQPDQIGQRKRPEFLLEHLYGGGNSGGGGLDAGEERRQGRC